MRKLTPPALYQVFFHFWIENPGENPGENPVPAQAMEKFSDVLGGGGEWTLVMRETAPSHCHCSSRDTETLQRAMSK